MHGNSLRQHYPCIKGHNSLLPHLSCHDLDLVTCGDPESFARGGPTLTFFFACFFMRGERVQIALKEGHHQSASETPFCWRADDGPTLKLGSFVIFQGIWTSIAKNPLFL